MRRLKWFPIRWALRRIVKTNGFLDPFKLLAQFQKFAQPSETAIPVEIMRLGSVLHARGVLNSQAIQHNLDWVWPFWVERQFDPHDPAFIPRSFSLSHINLTHRNWTAVGMPDCALYPIVDPAGLVTPFYDSWSIDAWIIFDSKEGLIPSRLASVKQRLLMDENFSVLTEASSGPASLSSKVKMIGEPSFPVCEIEVQANSKVKAWCVISLRPYNPEGISLIYEIKNLEEHHGWKVNGKDWVYLSEAPERCAFSNYKNGDVHHFLPHARHRDGIACPVGMATAAASYEIKPGETREIKVEIPLKTGNGALLRVAKHVPSREAWTKNLEGTCRLEIPDPQFQFLYDAAVRNLVLHAPAEIYPGPYTYKHFWFRDAAFILHALLCAGLIERAEKVIRQSFFSRQTPFGYFHSQDGEWDSNGQALWILRRFCELSGRAPAEEWKKPIEKGARWIERKRIRENLPEPHAGLFPPGFSAEHLGPSDYYYWDDFWGAAGLSAASYLMERYGDKKRALAWQKKSGQFLKSIEESLKIVEKRLGHLAMPASPYRRMDSGAVGSLVAGYPLQFWDPQDLRVLETADYLMRECRVDGGLFHDMSHSGINPYLTLHLAQVLLRAGDPRHYEVMKAVAHLASPTGQWPEAIHPETKGGCMGDGQHIWAAAEWILMIRNCFVREEGESLVLFSGIPREWLESDENLNARANSREISFGPAPTKFGTLRLSLKAEEEKIKLHWEGQWFLRPPKILIELPGHTGFFTEENQTEAELLLVPK